MPLRVLDGNQTATTLSSVVTGGEHIVAHSVVSLGANAIADFRSAVSGSVVSISNFPSTQTIAGTVTANTAYAVNVTGNAGGAASTVTAIPVALVDRGVYGGNLLGYNGTNTYLNTAIESVGGNSLRAGGTFPVSGTVTIGSLPAISGTVTANVIGKNAIFGGTEFFQLPVIGFDEQIESADVGVVVPVQITNNLGVVGASNPLPISGTVTANAILQNANAMAQAFIDESDAYGAVGVSIVNSAGNIAVVGTVTAAAPNGSLTTRFGTPTTANVSFATAAVTKSDRKYLLIQNVTTGSNVITVGIGFTPTTTQGIQLTAGAGITFESSYIPTGAVYVLSSVTASNFTILEA